MARHNEIGRIGEEIAEKWLVSQKYHILERNYLKKYGEIDIVARETGGKVHFIEVKSVSHGTMHELDKSVSHGTSRPEENVHSEKQRSLGNTIESWLLERDYKGDWQIDIILVHLVTREKYAKVRCLWNVIFE